MRTARISLRFRVWRKVRSYSVDEKPRINPVGVQHLSEHLHAQVFGSIKEENAKTDEALIRLSRQFLKKHGLLGKKTVVSKPISFDLPALQGKSLDEHFQRLGQYASQPYLNKARNKFTQLPPKPKTWIRKSGWIRYSPNEKPEPVSFPREETIVFDVETLYKISPYPTLAIAVSDKAWYCWCSPYICADSDDPTHLIPLDTLTRTRLVIGHNVGYDRARVLEEYNCQESKAFFLDTMSLHIATSGMCSRQRPQWMQKRKAQDLKTENEADLLLEAEDEEPWTSLSALNSLQDVALLHCGIKLDKDKRDSFATRNKNDIINDFKTMADYCARDVEATSRVFDVVFPMFLKKCPHPVSFGGLRLLSTSILPTKRNAWNDYIARSESLYQSSKQNIEQKILTIVQDVVKLKDNPTSARTDPWLNQLDWELKPLRLTKKGIPARGQKLPGFPEWYRQLFPSKNTKLPNITMRNRLIPLFFKLSWEGEPVVWTLSDGWCFEAPAARLDEMKEKNYFLANSADNSRPGYKLFKIPHPNGPDFNCTTLLSKQYIQYFEKGILTSHSDLAKEALGINSSCSYWISARERVMSQFVVSANDFPLQFRALDGDRVGDDNTSIILPAVIPMGTVTRRSVEKTWLTASNAKKTRIGSELKAQIMAPPGYAFVGADVDSEELWIASLVSDSVFKIHGGTPIGWMCLEGSKNEGTDLHTKTAKILQCSRNEAKIFNYGRIYGAGVKFATRLLKKFNPNLTDSEAKNMAEKLYGSTKGLAKHSKNFKKFWYGGSESILFNKLEHIAEQEAPKTPVLGAGITHSLMKGNLGSNSFLPSRINWAIQSSGVDYLHLLCCSMNYLIKKYGLKARLSISIHDEIRYLTSEDDKYRTALALQISNLWTRAIFCEQMGINELPQNCAFFSAIDIDHVLRKEVDMDCITPSNKNPIPHGESLDITRLLALPASEFKAPTTDIDLSEMPYERRETVFSIQDKKHNKDFLDSFLRLQIQSAKWKVDELEVDYLRKVHQTNHTQDLSNIVMDYVDAKEAGEYHRPKHKILVPGDSSPSDNSEGGMGDDDAMSHCCNEAVTDVPYEVGYQKSLELQHQLAGNKGEEIFPTRTKEFKKNFSGRGAAYRLFDECIDISRGAAERRQKKFVDERIDIDAIVENVVGGKKATKTKARRTKTNLSNTPKRRGSKIVSQYMLEKGNQHFPPPMSDREPVTEKM
ncbi:LADA_0F07558g1_1 [Lachancea dasiensis]|uniref:DNA polymerase gamma n=1 Tax=Lachancea dasiensis TaxID=1072105 RepID=A0A1G4JKU8_9SACH|nr:LADA_0F07558g1_1 [Lachancea dasiensis]